MSILLNKFTVSVCMVIMLCSCGTDVHRINSYPTLSKPEIHGIIKDRKVKEGLWRTSIDGVNLFVATELGMYVSETGWALIPIPASKEYLEYRNKQMRDHFMVVVGLNTETKEEQASIRNITGKITFLDDGSILYPSKINQSKRRSCDPVPFLGEEISEPLLIEYKWGESKGSSNEDILADRSDLPLYTCFQFIYDHPADPRRVFEFQLGELIHVTGQVNPVRVFFEPGNLRYFHP